MRSFHVELLRAVGRFACERRVAVLAAAALLTVLSWLPIFLSGVDQAFNVARLLPQEVPAARDFTQVVTDFGSTDEGVIVFRLGGRDDRASTPEAGRARRALVVNANGTPGPVGALADDIVRRLKMNGGDGEPIPGQPVFRDVYCRKFAETDRDYLRYEALANGGLLLVDDRDLATAEAVLRPERIRDNVRSFARLRRNIGRDKEVTLAAVQFDSLGLRPLIKRALARYGGADTDAPPEKAEAEAAVEAETGDGDGGGGEKGFFDIAGPGYLLDPDNRLLLLIYQPDQPAQKMEYSKAVVERVRREAEAALAALPEDARRRVQIEFTGGYEVAVLHERNVYAALRDTFVSTMIGVLVLFGLAFRRPGTLLYVGLPLVLIVSWTVGLGFLAFGRLNMISCAFAAVLVSLGIDYAIHIYNRYIEERQRGSDVSEAFQEALAHTGWGVVMGMVTTAAAFLALLGTRFSQLTEFGLLVGCGLALAVPVMFFVLPALIALRHGRRAEHERAVRPLLFGLPALARFVGRHRLACVAGGAALGAAAALSIFIFGDRMRFDERIDPLRPPMRALEVGAEVARAFSNRTGSSVMVVAYSDLSGRAGEEEALERAARQSDACRLLLRETINGRPALEDYESLARFLPAPSAQRRSLARLAAVDWDAAIAAFREAAADAMPDAYVGIEADGSFAPALMLPWDELQREFALDREAELAGIPAADTAARTRRATEFDKLRREWLAYTFPLRFLLKHRAMAAAGEPLLVSDFDRTPLARYLARLATTRKREVDFREPLPVDLDFPVALAVDAEDREGKVRVRAGARFNDAGSLRALYDDPALERSGQVRRAVLACPGWAVKTKLYPPIDPTTRTGDPLLGEDWVAMARERLDAPVVDAPPASAAVEGATPVHAILTGIPLLAHELAEIVKEDFRRLSIWVLIGAVVALGLFFRRHPGRVAASLLPIVLGMLYLFGIMVLAGVRMNFVNVLVIPVLIGLGVDSGIHIVQRYFETGRRLDATVGGTGRAIVITGLTSMIGFGSLGFGAYGGAAGMGALMIVGLAASMLVSLVVLPAALALAAPPPAEPDDVLEGEAEAVDAPPPPDGER